MSSFVQSVRKSIEFSSCFAFFFLSRVNSTQSRHEDEEAEKNETKNCAQRKTRRRLKKAALM